MMSEWKIKIIEQDGNAYAKDLFYSEDDPEVKIQGSKERGESARLGYLWISKNQIKEIYEFLFPRVEGD